MKNTIIILLITLASSVGLFAQENITCPNIEIIGPQSSVSEGQTMTFTIKIIGGDKEPKIKWSVDKGKIGSGQGKNSITVATDDLDDETLVATAFIANLPEGCQSNFSETGIITGKPEGQPVDDFGDIADDDVRARIDAYIAALQNSPNTMGCIINYGQPINVVEREKLIRGHIKFREYDKSRFILRYIAQEGRIRTVLWLVPSGADESCSEL